VAVEDQVDDQSRTTVVLDDGDVRMAVVHVVGPEPPDLTVVAAVARLRLMAGRMGWAIHIENPCFHLCELLELAGLSEVLLAPRQRRPGEAHDLDLDTWLGQLDVIDLGDGPSGDQDPDGSDHRMARRPDGAAAWLTRLVSRPRRRTRWRPGRRRPGRW
jgi:hypothetical protein